MDDELKNHVDCRKRETQFIRIWDVDQSLGLPGVGMFEAHQYELVLYVQANFDTYIFSYLFSLLL